MFDGSARVNIYNDAHDDKRYAADIAHEVAHGLPSQRPIPLFNAGGSRHYHREFEAEAKWLGPALFIWDDPPVRQLLYVGNWRDWRVGSARRFNDR